MSKRRTPNQGQSSQHHASFGQHNSQADQFDDLGQVISSSSHGNPDSHQQGQHEYLGYAGSSARFTSDRDDYDDPVSLRERRNNPERSYSRTLHRYGGATDSTPLDRLDDSSSQSLATRAADDLEDDASIGTDDGIDETEQGWIEEDPTSSTSTTLSSQARRNRRFRLTHDQTRFLTNEFSRQQHPDSAQRERLAKAIPGLSPRQVQVWFQNRRAKIKRLNSEEQQRIERLRASASSAATSPSSYPPYNLPLYNASIPASSSTLPSLYGQMASFGNLSLDSPRRESGGTMYSPNIPGLSGAGGMYGMPALSLQTGSTRTSNNHPTYPYSPNSASQFGASWQNQYTNTSDTPSSLGALPSFLSAGTSTAVSPASYGGTTLLEDLDSSSSTSHINYGSASSFAPMAGLPYNATSLYQIDSLRRSSPYEVSQYGLRNQISNTPDDAPGSASSYRRHDSINEPAQQPSSSYDGFPSNYTSSHSPHYHGYNG